MALGGAAVPPRSGHTVPIGGRSSGATGGSSRSVAAAPELLAPLIIEPGLGATQVLPRDRGQPASGDRMCIVTALVPALIVGVVVGLLVSIVIGAVVFVVLWVAGALALWAWRRAGLAASGRGAPG